MKTKAPQPPSVKDGLKKINIVGNEIVNCGPVKQVDTTFKSQASSQVETINLKKVNWDKNILDSLVSTKNTIYNINKHHASVDLPYPYLCLICN